MELIRLFEKSFVNEEEKTYKLEYSLLVHSMEQREAYGVAVMKNDDAGNRESEQAEGLCESREEAEQFLYRLAENLTLPVELIALCDNYITEKECSAE